MKNSMSESLHFQNFPAQKTNLYIKTSLSHPSSPFNLLCPNPSSLLFFFLLLLLLYISLSLSAMEATALLNSIALQHLGHDNKENISPPHLPPNQVDPVRPFTTCKKYCNVTLRSRKPLRDITHLFLNSSSYSSFTTSSSPGDGGDLSLPVFVAQSNRGKRKASGVLNLGHGEADSKSPRMNFR
ncbi:hypothetical protein Dimus_009521 [Dionaea muscipula]